MLLLMRLHSNTVVVEWRGVYQVPVRGQLPIAARNDNLHCIERKGTHNLKEKALLTCWVFCKSDRDILILLGSPSRTLRLAAFSCTAAMDESTEVAEAAAAAAAAAVTIGGECCLDDGEMTPILRTWCPGECG